jgi:hypothetical protein
MENGGADRGETEDFSGVLDRLDPRSREVLILLWEGAGQAEVARAAGARRGCGGADSCAGPRETAGSL